MRPPYESPLESFADRAFTPEELGIFPGDEMIIGGERRSTANPPVGFSVRTDLGIVAPEGVDLRCIHAWPKPYDFAEAPRACFTPDGDLLMMCVTGRGHQWGKEEKNNEIVAYRSSDEGLSWTGPTWPWRVSTNEHAFNPLIPRGGQRIVAFGTDYDPEFILLPHSGVLGIRHSDDGGRTWSELRRVTPVNDPGMRGVFHMQGCETDSGAWLLGTYTIEKGGPDGRIDHQYVLRSEDQGESWELLPGTRPTGWMVDQYQRMLEGRIINVGGGEYLMLTRTLEGHVWQLRSNDDGRTWSKPEPTALAHPDAPPMVAHLSDGETLLTLIHNKPGGNARCRDELWCSLSNDRGLSWSEPRFLLANAAAPCNSDGFPGWTGEKLNMEVCYADILSADGIAHIFYNHVKRNVHYLRIEEGRLHELPTREELRRRRVIASGVSL